MAVDPGQRSPYFSIVVPVYNREHLLRRAVGSCLRQSFADFELIIVDDASTDDSANVAQMLAKRDSRIRVLRHERNRGVCPARNTGIAQSTGQWVICLDSDDELVEGALSVMQSEVDGVDAADGLRFMCIGDDGMCSPSPPLRPGPMSYVEYLKWAADSSIESAESLICVRRSTFERVRYPDSRAFESGYHLDFALFFSMCNSRQVVRRYHQDAENSLCRHPTASSIVKNSSDHAAEYLRILIEHGAAMRAHVPALYSDFVRAMITDSLLAGERAKALQRLKRVGPAGFFSARLLATFGIGMVSARVLALAKASLIRWRASRVRGSVAG